jgi:hypothetical protein
MKSPSTGMELGHRWLETDGKKPAKVELLEAFLALLIAVQKENETFFNILASKFPSTKDVGFYSITRINRCWQTCCLEKKILFCQNFCSILAKTLRQQRVIFFVFFSVFAKLSKSFAKKSLCPCCFYEGIFI